MENKKKKKKQSENIRSPVTTSGWPNRHTTANTVLGDFRIQGRTKSTTNKLEGGTRPAKTSIKDGVHLGGKRGGNS